MALIASKYQVVSSRRLVKKSASGRAFSKCASVNIISTKVEKESLSTSIDKIVYGL